MWVKRVGIGLLVFLASAFLIRASLAKKQVNVAPPAKIPIIVGGTQIGVIVIQPRPGGGMQGKFRPNDPSTQTMNQLEQQLGQDHMNWFQVVTGGTRGPRPGQQFPYVDPPNGGSPPNGNSPGAPADGQPWFWDEPPYNGGDPNNGINGGNPPNTGPGYILILDGPVGAPGTTTTFQTFLMSIFKDGTYQPLGGFSWTVTYGPGPHDSTITNITTWTTVFPPGYQTTIGNFPPNPYTGKPWKIHPAPPAP